MEWEVYALYRHTRNPDAVAGHLSKIAQTRALSFFVGTSLRHHVRGTFMIIGLFYPPRIIRQSLL
jgi:hypothetical protein